MTRSSVDLPQPDGPMSETNSPGVELEVDVLERGDVPVRERLRDVADLDDGLLLAHATASGARRTTSFSAMTTTTKKTMPSSAATMFVAQSSCGSIE